MKKLIIALLLVMFAIVTSATIAQTDSLISNELYFQTADAGSWTAVDSENGTLTLSGVNPRLQYTMTTPRLWSVALENSSFIETWSLITDIAPLEAILSFGTYNVRLLIESPAWGEAEGNLSYTAQVVEVINFADETTKEIPSSFEFPTLTIQPTRDFTLALMEGANNRLVGTRNADECAVAYENYLAAQRALDEVMGDGPVIGSGNREQFAIFHFKYVNAVKLYMDKCLLSIDMPQ